MTTPAAPTPVALDTLQQVTLTATETNAAGGAVTPTDALVWSVDNTAAVTLTPSADSLSCLCVATAAGTAMVTVNDPAAGLTSAAQELDISTAAATEIAIIAGAPEDQAPAA
jgi:hypothetical protein